LYTTVTIAMAISVALDIFDLAILMTRFMKVSKGNPARLQAKVVIHEQNRRVFDRAQKNTERLSFR
jgi:hypothetical protein